MEQQVQSIENQDPEEVNILRAVNRGETRLETVDWKTYLSEIVKMIGLMKDPISYIGCAWALLQEIDDYAQRADILSKWQDAAPECFPTQEAAEAFHSDAECLKDIDYRLRGLVLLQGAELPNTYDHVDGGKGLNEMALLWSDKYVSGSALVELASEIHKTVSAGNKDPLIEYFLYANRNRNQLPFENIYDFSRNLFLAESFRQYLVTGKMYTSEPITFGDFKRKLRNACFEEYIRLRFEQTRKELDEDNWQLLDPTDEECYEEIYKQEKSVYDRETMFESFRGSQAYHDRYYRGRPEVLNMMQYFMKYLEWKMENLNEDTMPKNQPTQVIHGDYIAGNKYTGTVIGTVAAGGIGVQINHGKQEKPADIPTEPKAEESKPQEQPQAEEIELTDGAIDLHLQLFKAAMLKVQDVKYSEIKFATAIMNTYEWYAVLRLGQDIGLLDGYTDLITLMKEGDFKHKPTNPQNVNPYKKHINTIPLYPNWQCAHRASEPYFRKFKFIADNTYSIYKLGCKEHHIRPFGSDK